ncbi:Fusarisetin A cluster transcription factor fsa6 [Fusarium torreyae]|uniref:Fusarisetin A cluster transcription factor fsa6 n=1 Tax=Fusarium torreyae TaxID=1237075 RepID=A0A9W8VBN2_9HYPO|nr:Fusarisetin A cluster transcription factor fsa6 [Fusarium torreyae]
MSNQQAHLPEWGPGKTAQGRARLPSSRPREKQQLSCNLCRRRKLRCDRQRPCGSCVQRELGLSCTYAHNDPDRVPGNDVTNQPRATTQDRIHHLEKLVFDLMQQSELGAATSPHRFTHASESSPLDVVNTDEPLTPSTDYGSIQPKDGGANYVGSAHWAAVLDEIAELKDHFDNEEASHPICPERDSPCAGVTSLQILHGFSKPATREDILASIPSRPVVNRLVSRYFNSFEMSPAVLHSVQFLKEYEEFWEDPSKASIIWLGLLFTIMCLATQFEKFRLDPGVQTPTALSMEEDLQKMASTFRRRIPQCLVLGNYTRGSPYVLETMMLYIAVEVFASSDAEIDIWILMGTTVQLAMHMGYHRDPRHFKGMSPFDAEMRRRVWATIVEMDLGISAQMGLPRMTKQWQTDTQEPSNLRDSDFDKSTVEMPPSRPATDLTPMLYRLVKARLMAKVGYIWDFAADVRSYPYAEVEKMDSRLDEIHLK